MNLVALLTSSRRWLWLPLVPIVGALLFLTSHVISQYRRPGPWLPPASSVISPTRSPSEKAADGGNAGSGGLGSLRFSSVHPGQSVEAPLVATDVRIEVTGPMARAKVTQHFENPSNGWVEGVYVFPLPEQAAVDTLRVRVGSRFIEGQIKECEEAKKVYEQAKAAGFKSALVEQDRPNVFKTSVANIGPRETVIVQIEFQQTLRFEAGHFALRFPMVVAPRYNPHAADELLLPPASSGPAAAAASSLAPAVAVLRPGESARTNRVTCHVDLRTGFALGDVQSSFHPVRLTRRSASEADVELVSPAVADRDFELTWAPVAGQAPSAHLFREQVGNDSYLLAMVVPPSLDVQSKPREVIFVIDNSGSMGGESIRQAKASLDLALARLEPHDTFNVIRFDDTMTQVFPDAVRATEDHLTTARTYVRSLQASGGTEMLPALQAALKTLPAESTERVRQVVFLTDGAVTNEDDMFTEIGQHLGSSRLYPIGIGPAPNSFFMARAARLGRGTFTHVGSGDQVTARTLDLWRRMESPVMTDLEAVLAGSEIWPRPVPDLHTGEPIVVTAQGTDANAMLSLRGRLSNGSPWAADLATATAAVGTGIGKLWARHKIDSVEERRFVDRVSAEQIDREVLEVALAFHLVSRRTSLVAVDVTPSRPASAEQNQQVVPLHLPAGWDFERVFGVLPSRGEGASSAASDLAFASQSNAASDLAFASQSDEKRSAIPGGSDVDLPGTATSMRMLLWQGVAWCVLAGALVVARRFVRSRLAAAASPSAS